MKPVLPIICTRYEVRNPMFHLPDIRHSFGEQSILVGYCLIKQLNAEEGSLTTDIIIIIINLLFQTIVHMDIKKNIYKTHIRNKLKIIRINGNQ